MKALSLSAAVAAAALLFGAGTVRAADLDYGYGPPPDRYSSAYEDPRYRDLYGAEPPRTYSYAPEPYAPRGPVPPGYVYRPGYDDRYGPGGRDEDRIAAGCLPHREIKQRLIEEGWTDFSDVDVRASVARVRARRHNGDLFSLKVDRCNGEVLRADLIERRGIGPYAWRDDPRRADRPYY